MVIYPHSTMSESSPVDRDLSRSPQLGKVAAAAEAAAKVAAAAEAAAAEAVASAAEDARAAAARSTQDAEEGA